MSSFRIGPVSVEVLDGQHAIAVVPPSQWHGDGQERPAHATLAKLKADDGLRAQVSLVRWDDSDEISLGFAERLNDLRTGRYPAGASQSPVATAPAAEAVPFDTPEDLPRPSIGGTWVGPIPELRYRRTRAGDVVHPDTMESVKSRVVGDPAEKLRAWTAVEPRGNELWIDTDGAIGGFIGATPRLLGYLGPDPEADIARGFFTPHFYAVEGDEIADLDSGERRKSPFAEGLADGATLRVTTYGDVLLVGDADGMERVATVTAAEWFPGHLG